MEAGIFVSVDVEGGVLVGVDKPVAIDYPPSAVPHSVVTRIRDGF